MPHAYRDIKSDVIALLTGELPPATSAERRLATRVTELLAGATPLADKDHDAAASIAIRPDNVIALSAYRTGTGRGLAR